MNSSQTNGMVDNSANSLIDWNSPEVVDNKTNIRELLNNPFDIMEFRAANMDPFDLVLNQTPHKKDPPCSNFLSPFREPKKRQIRKSVSLPDLVNVADIVDKNYRELVNGLVMKNQSKVVDVKTNNDIIDLSYENCLSENLSENKVTNNLEHNIELFLEQDLSKVNIEQISLCNEEEKKQIREETRQKIEKLIEQEKHVYKENCSRRSLSLNTPQRKSNANLDDEKNLFYKRFIGNDSCSNSEGYHSASNTSVYVSNNISNDSSMSCARELSSFDLNSLKPEWVVDDFSDNDASYLDIQSKDMSVVEGHGLIDVKSKALDCIETLESKTNGGKKSMLTKRIPTKGPFLANIPLQQMVQHYEGIDFKLTNHQTSDKARPLVTSASKLDTLDVIKTPLAKPRRSSLPRHSISNFNKSPITPLNTKKCIKKPSNNVLNDLHDNTLFQQNILHSNNLNSSTHLFSVATEKKLEIQNAFQVNKSNAKSKIGKGSIPVVSNMKKVTSLPVSKRSPMLFKGKENVKFRRTNVL